MKTSNFYWSGKRNLGTFWHENHFLFYFFSIANWWLFLLLISIAFWIPSEHVLPKTLNNKWVRHFYLFHHFSSVILFLLLTRKTFFINIFVWSKTCSNLILLQCCFGSIDTVFPIQDGKKTTHGSCRKKKKVKSKASRKVNRHREKSYDANSAAVLQIINLIRGRKCPSQNWRTSKKMGLQELKSTEKKGRTSRAVSRTNRVWKMGGHPKQEVPK